MSGDELLEIITFSNQKKSRLNLKGETILWEINSDIAVFTNDERVIAHIGSITVLSSINDVSLICGAQVAGCASPRWGIDLSDFTTDILFGYVFSFGSINPPQPFGKEL